MARIAKTDVHAALQRAANHIVDAGGDDGVVSRKDIKKKLETLKGSERALVDMFYRFVDHRDASPGARVTKSDVEEAVAYAKDRLIDAYDLNNNGLSKGEILRMSRTGKLAVELSRQLKEVANPEPDVTREARIDAIYQALDAEGAVNGYMFEPSARFSTSHASHRDFPNVVSDALRLEGNGIMHRWPGTGFDAEIYGYYTIYDNADHDNIMAYAILGGGSDAGEDYQEGVLIAVDPDGGVIFHEEDSW